MNQVVGIDCDKWRLADVVVKEEGDHSFIRICKQFSKKKGGLDIICASCYEVVKGEQSSPIH